MSYVIPREVLDAQPSVFPYHVGQERVFVKKGTRNKNPLGKLAQHALFFLTNNMLVAPTAWKPEDRVAIEVAALRKLDANGFRVPKVLHVGGDYFVMSDVGTTLEAVFSRNPGAAPVLVPKVVRELRRLHDHGFAHGGAQIKNIAEKSGEIYFLDLEEAIPEKMVGTFQLRDLFLLLFSLEREGHNPDLEGICEIYDGDAPKCTLASLAKALRQMRIARVLDHRWLSFLSMRDVRSLNRLIGKAANGLAKH